MVRSFGTEISGNRRPKAELSPEQRIAIVYGKELGRSAISLAEEFGCGRTTIYDTWHRFQSHQTVDLLPRSGRPKLISPRAERQVY
jgi:transposase